MWSTCHFAFGVSKEEVLSDEHTSIGVNEDRVVFS